METIFSTHLGIPDRVGTNTEYVIALVPLGGYVKMAGSLDESLDAEITGALMNSLVKVFYRKYGF